MENIASKAPVDRVAAIVTSKGYRYIPDKKTGPNHWETCPEMRRYRRVAGGCTNLTGVRFGRFVVVGLYAGKTGNGESTSVWVCRCACGRFETRTARVVKNGKDNDDCCDMCRHLKYLKRNEEYRRTGRNAKPRVERRG